MLHLDCKFSHEIEGIARGGSAFDCVYLHVFLITVFVIRMEHSTEERDIMQLH